MAFTRHSLFATRTMSIEFYKHRDMPDDMNEKRAFFRVARLLDRLFRNSDDHYLLIANVDTHQDSTMPNLPQLDGVLLGTRLFANLEFKNYYDPILGRGPRGRWYTQKKGKNDQIVAGGASDNPYQQAQNAKSRWVAYLDEVAPALPIPWKYIQHFVLFHPYLHSQSRISVRGIDHYWLHFASVGDIGELIAGSELPNLALTPRQMSDLARNVWHAERWHDVDRILNRKVGYIHVQIPDATPVGYPLYSFSEWTIGRKPSGGQHIQIPYKLISGRHARLEVRGEAVRLFDTGSKNGTRLNGRKLDNEMGALLQGGETAVLGGKGKKAVKLWFESTKTTPADDFTYTATADSS